MNLVDTHTHIYLEEFDDDQDEMIERAEREGVRKFFLPAIDSATHHVMFGLENRYPGRCFSMMGLHPCSVKENFNAELELVRAELERRKFSAIGEIGLDFYWDRSFTDQQTDAFHRQLDWAVEFDLPVSIHSRNSTDECTAIVKEHQDGRLKGVFHCFSGDVEQAKKIIDLGFYLGIGGVLTFKNSGLDKVMEHISIDHVVLETDAPYLAPVPFRGKRNEPAYLKFIAERLGMIKNIPVEEVALITTRNAIASSASLFLINEVPNAPSQ
jgi:TatD DNase family protein